MRRSEQRKATVFALYKEDVAGPGGEALPSFGAELYEGVGEHRDEIDALIDKNAMGWDIARIAPLERAILRVASFEIVYRGDIPNEVAINEAIEIAKQYCGADAPGFINGILGAIVKEAST